MPQAAVGGVASFSNLTLGNAASVATIQATSPGVVGAITNSITITPAPAVQLIVTTPLPGSATANVGFGLTVSAEDGSGNVDPTYTGTVTIALANNPGVAGTTLGGTLTATAVHGVAVFSGLTLTSAASGYTFLLTSGGLIAATAGPLNVVAAAATKLSVTAQPPVSVPPANGFGLVVQAMDSFGNVDLTYNGPVTLTIATNAGNSTLGGTTTVAAVAGVATFSGLTLNNLGTGYTLKAASGSLSQATTAAFNVANLPATQLSVSTEPSSSVIINTGFNLAVTALDVNGNPVQSYSGTVALALASGPAGGVLSGPQMVTVVNGVATFSGLSLNLAGSNYTIQASSGGLPAVTTTPITVTPLPATQLVIATQPPATVANGSAFSIVAFIEDLNGHVVATPSASVTLTLVTNPGGSTLNPVTVTTVNGVATFSGLTLNKIGTGYTFQLTSTGLTSATTSAITVTPLAATQLVLTGQPPTTATVGVPFVTQVVVKAEDANGNVDPTFSGPVTLTLGTNTGSSTLGGTTTVFANAGVATFPTNLSLNNGVAGTATIVATSGSLTKASNSITVAAATADATGW